MIVVAALLAAAAPATVLSPAAERLSVTIYRDPGRGRDQRMSLSRLGGFALVTETRTIAVPAGEAVLRFEGVAGGIIPASAIVEGLPGTTIEKNRDARLLSPAALVDGTLGRQVTLRRTDKATGKVREEEATILAGPAGGVVLRTPTGIETLGCAGLPEGIRYGGVPDGLSARPVLSVRTHSPAARRVTVTLSYLATEFDWSASYVATIAQDGRTLDLFAWLTLANANAEGLPDASTQAVAGRLAWRRTYDYRAAASRLALACYPLGTTTSDLKTVRGRMSEDIVLTARRRTFDVMEKPMAMAMAAPVAPPPPPPPPPPEDLGDLKLYRVPERVSIAAKGQKQVALLEKRGVPFERFYRIPVQPGQVASDISARIVLRMRNDAANGLGLALPAGSTTLYAPAGGTTLLVGTGTLGDKAAGEKVELEAGTSRQVLAGQQVDADRTSRLTLTNATPSNVTVEVPIGYAGQADLRSAGTPLPRIDGVQTWRVTVPANGTVSLVYGMARPEVVRGR